MNEPALSPHAETLQEQETAWREVFNATSEAIFIHDAATARVLDVNDRTLRMFGLSRAEALGVSAADLCLGHPPYSEVEALSWIRRAIEAGPQLFEWRARRKNGELFWCEVSLRQSQLGGQGRVLAVVRDISQRKDAEAELLEHEARYRALFDRSVDCVFLNDFAGNFLDANQAALDLLGYQREDLPRLNFHCVMSPDQLPLAFQNVEEILRTGSQQTPAEFRLRHRHGGYVDVETRSSLIYRHGKPYAIQGIARDITQRKQAEARLHFQALLLDQISDTVTATDLDGNIIFANASQCRAIQRPREEVIGASVQLYGDDPARGATQRQIIETTRAQGTWRGEIINRDRQGREFVVDCRTTLLRDAAGRPIGMCGVGTDVTDRRRLEEQVRHLQKMESIGQLAAGVAHDFNNILTIINGSASLLAEALRDRPEYLEGIHQIAAAGERAANLTRQLLLFSRKEQMRPVALNLNELTSNLTKMLGRILGEHITLEFTYENDLPCVQADPGMLEQVILNLAVNARDAMPQGGTLNIATTTLEFRADPPPANPEARPGRFVRLTVRDTGCGIAPEVRAHLFEPFFTTKEIGKGTGLGLATVYGIVKQHQGWIEVQSAPGQGATFTIHLPASTVPCADPERIPAPAPARGGGQTILVVEDEAPVRDLIFHLLRRSGYQVLTARSGPEAQQLPADQLRRVDLLLADLVLPGGVNGRDLATALRRIHPRLQVVYCSGYSPEIAGGWLPLEAEVIFLQKPFTPHQLLQAVASSLSS